MSGKKASSGLTARIAAASNVSPVAAGFAAAMVPEPAEKVEVVAVNIRLPKPLHRALKQAALDGDMSLNAIVVRATAEWLDRSR